MEYFIKDVPNYIEKTSNELKDTLALLRRNGIKLMIISNNYYFMNKATLEYCFGDDWTDHFDYIITKA